MTGFINIIRKKRPNVVYSNTNDNGHIHLAPWSKQHNIMDSETNNLEIEVKFHVTDASQMQQRIIDLGAVVRPKVFETNVRYEDPGNNLKRAGKLLRLRKDKTCRLTFKSRPNHQDPECKVYQELEVGVNDFDTMAAILDALGYKKVQIYEKWRQTFSWRDVLLCLDIMPYGIFLEIEGPKKGIKTTAHMLGLPWSKRILENYLAIFDVLRKDCGLPFYDVTFYNFKQYQVDITPYLASLQADDTANECR